MPAKSNLKASSEKILPGVWRITIGQPEKHTPCQLRDIPPAEQGFSSLPKPGKQPFPISKVKAMLRPRGLTVRLPFFNQEHLFGLGLQLKSFDQTMLKKTLRVNSDPVADTGDSHAPVPFYVSTEGYGILVDTARYATFYMGSHAEVGSKPPSKTDEHLVPDSTEALYRQRSLGERQVVIDIPVAEGVDIYVFAGPTLRDAVSRYNLFSGGGCLPAMWGLGNWYRIWTKHDQQGAAELARYFREKKIPCDVFGFEPGWQERTYSCSYTWSKERFPDPQPLLDELNDLGWKPNLWEHVFVHPTAPIYDKMKKHAGDFEVWQGLVPDLTIPAAQKVFADHHRDSFIQKGVYGFKCDECDNSDFLWFPWSFPEAASFPSGMDGEQMHTMLGTLFQQTTYDALRQENVRTLCQVRSAGALAAPYPFVLYSDLYNHKDFLRGVATAAFSGLLWSPEVRQCESFEAMIRRVQAVVVSPHSLINAWMIRNPPWIHVTKQENNEGKRMKEWKQAEKLVRDLFELRMKLLPMLYSAFAKYHDTGLPPVRPLVMDYVEDEQTFSIADQWLLGDNLLVAPLLADQTERKVYLPEGDWYDFNSGQRLKGKQWITTKPALEEIPMYVKANTILPLAKPVQFVARDTVFDITLHAYGKGPFQTCELFEDDGFTYAHESGAFNWVTFSMDKKGKADLQRRGQYDGQRYRLVDSVHVK